MLDVKTLFTKILTLIKNTKDTAENSALIGTGYGSEIPSNDDLNDYVTPGNYYCQATSTAGTLTNCPVARAFRMYVINSAGTGTERIQLFMPYRSGRTTAVVEVWGRRITNSSPSAPTWSPWVQISNPLTAPYAFDNTDFDNITYPGAYYVGNSAGISNSPTTAKYWTVIVTGVASGQGIKQIASPYTANTWHVRNYYNGTWSSWMRLGDNDESLFQRVRYTYTYSVAANGSVSVTKDNLGISIPSGYSMGGYVGISTANANVVPRSWNPLSTQTGASIVLRNVSSTAQNNQTLTVDVLYLKTGHVG